MKKLVVVLSFLSILTNLPAEAKRQVDQVSLYGQVFDYEDGNPIPWATVALLDADENVVAGTSTDEDGYFVLRSLPGKYILRCSFIGYEDQQQTVDLQGDVVEIAPIKLALSAQMLESAKVTEKVNLVEMKLDKLVMNVSQSAFAQGSNALELMKKAPGVTIDKDGNVKLNGKSVSVWIDGRPSYLDGKALEALLRSTNGESIDKFELMENPSSKYDAAGQGGIINIKTKRNLLQGFNGSTGLGGGGMHFSDIADTPWQESWWMNLAYRTEKTNSFFNIYEGFDNTPINIVNDLNYQNIRQLGKTVLLNRFHNFNVKLGSDWFIDQKNTLGFILYAPGSKSRSWTSNSSTDIYRDEVLSNSSKSRIENISKSLQGNANLNYTHIFDETKAQELTLNLDYYKNMTEDDNRQVDTVLSLPQLLPLNLLKQSVYALKDYDVYSAKADYQGVVAGKYMLEAGAKWALSSTVNNSTENKHEVIFKSDFNYREHVAATYASIAGQIGPQWSFKVGLRGEYTNSFGDWKSSAQQTKRSYFDLFPTVFVGYNPSAAWRLGFSYTRRIDRPRYEQLNPTKTYVDSKTYTQGNPDIQPQYSDNFALNIGYGQHLSLSLNYNTMTQVINQIPSLTPEGEEVMTWGNIGSQDMAGAFFNVAALPIGKYLQWTLSGGAYYVQSLTYATKTKRESLAFQAYTDLSLLLPKDWKLSVDAYAMTPMIFGCYYIHGRWGANMALKKNISERLSIGIRLDDIFRTSNSNLDIIDENGSNSKTYLTQEFYSQKILFDLTWTFGSTQKPVKSRKVGNLEEISRGSGSSSGGLGQ